jgi:hypothetical protein
MAVCADTEYLKKLSEIQPFLRNGNKRGYLFFDHEKGIPFIASSNFSAGVFDLRHYLTRGESYKTLGNTIIDISI